MIRLALSIARVIVKREVALDESIVRNNIAAAVALAARRGGLEIRVHPADRLLMDQFVPELAERFDGLEIVRVVEDVHLLDAGRVRGRQRPVEEGAHRDEPPGARVLQLPRDVVLGGQR